MAARLEWNGPMLQLGPFIMADVQWDVAKKHRFQLRVVGVRGIASDPYESIVDCMQDCEAEVRRLLREAGVVIDG